MKGNEGEVTKAIRWRWVTAQSLRDMPRREEGGEEGKRKVMSWVSFQKLT